MSDDLRDFSLRHHIARVISSLVATALVAVKTYVGIKWVFGIGQRRPSVRPDSVMDVTHEKAPPVRRSQSVESSSGPRQGRLKA